jgi:hypothetical protein
MEICNISETAKVIKSKLSANAERDIELGQITQFASCLSKGWICKILGMAIK